MASLTLDFPEDNIVDLDMIQKLKSDFKKTADKVVENDFNVSTKEMKQLLQVYLSEYEKASKLTVGDKKPPSLDNVTIFPAIVLLREAILTMMVFVYSELVKKLNEDIEVKEKSLGNIAKIIADRVKKNPEKYTKVLEELGLEYSDKKIDNALNTTNFENLKTMEKQVGFIKQPIHGKINKKINFFNLGKNNDWRKILDKDIANQISKKFEKEMKELNYLN